MPITLTDNIVQALMTSPVFKTDTRMLFFLLAHPESVTTADISKTVGISPKAVNRSLKRLAGAGIIQPGEPEPRTRRFNIPGIDREGPLVEPVPDKRKSFGNRLDRIEATIARLVDTRWDTEGAGEDATGTRTDTEQYPAGTAKTPEGDQEGRQMDTHYNSLLASSLKEANSSSLQPGDEFRELFGVQVPGDFTDHADVAEMVRRKKAGKLADIKNPVGYLRSLAGKVPAAPDQSAGKPAKEGSHVPPAIDQARVEIENAIRQKWFALTDMDREPYRMKARSIQDAGGQQFKVPIELLARAQFNREQLAVCRG